MFLKLKFLEGWSLENRRQKQLKNFFFFFLTYIFLKGWPRENRWQKKP